REHIRIVGSGELPGVAGGLLLLLVVTGAAEQGTHPGPPVSPMIREALAAPLPRHEHPPTAEAEGGPLMHPAPAPARHHPGMSPIRLDPVEKPVRTLCRTGGDPKLSPQPF